MARNFYYARTRGGKTETSALIEVFSFASDTRMGVLIFICQSSNGQGGAWVICAPSRRPNHFVAFG
ncbi:MAG: hypothetical protein DMF00_05420 [Verrucomicrobia bacterium]|nr:MAG: hypothetical protein DMF00_05420 [Verrucomicrobiota bacterium]